MPLSYTFSSRIKTIGERISWVLIYPLFLAWVIYLTNESFILFLLSFFITMSNYEIGYLYNDVITTKKEEKPTIRHNAYIENNFHKIVLSRFFFCLLGLIFIYYHYSLEDSLTIAFLLILTQIVFYIHNTIRSKANILSYILLVSLRYSTPIFFALNTQLFFTIFLIFPLCRTLEHACKKKYNIIPLQILIKKPDVFRVFYLLVSTILLYFIFGYSIYIKVILYFLVIRIAALIASKFSTFKRNKHHSY